MTHQTRIVSPGPQAGSVRTPDGQILHAPADWVVTPPGDAALSRRLKAAGPSWTVQERKGRKTFSRGIWAAAVTVESIKADLARERQTPEFARKRQKDVERRQREQHHYVAEFHEAVISFLAFDAKHRELAQQLARAVTEHATPVGSGTVARTARISVEERAEAAVIAWMRHRTTAYEHMAIPRVAGQRREVRRMLAARSRALLDSYRAGRNVDPASCPLQRALCSWHPVGG
ncbi:MAG TPA: DUF2293 domain-containing protein [Tepidisphaeraceae bacterium]|nr:DUF2293 domain-containing protein [Tepidisphaeraceae bacterium]